MRSTVVVKLSAADRKRLVAIVDSQASTPKQVRRCQVILFSADGLRPGEIMRRTGASKWSVWRWQDRFVADGIKSLLHDRTRPPGKRPLGEAVAVMAVGLALSEPPGGATRWTGRLMAGTVGISLTSVQRIWRAYGVDPRRLRTFKLSGASKFAGRFGDIAGVYIGKGHRALALSVPNISASAPQDTPTQTDTSSSAEGREHPDGQRRLALALGAALERLERNGSERGPAAGRREDFIAFLDHVDRAASASHRLHAVLELPKGEPRLNIVSWLGLHPRWTVHALPDTLPWRAATPGVVSALNNRRPWRGAFSNVSDLQGALDAFMKTGASPSSPFIWTSAPER